MKQEEKEIKYDINRFISIQKNYYHYVYKEIKNGYKKTHWMWFMFPQYVGLGESSMSMYYSIKSVDEAITYLNNEYLNNNIYELCKILLEHENISSMEIFGYIDNLKLQSSMTLFDYVYEFHNDKILIKKNNIFIEVLNKYYDGKKDSKTIELILSNSKF